MLSRLVGAIRALFDSTETERVQLNRDARVVIEQAQAAYGRQTLRDMALLVESELRSALDASRDDNVSVQHHINRVRELHRGARRKSEQLGLTAYTLAIIYLRSLRHGDGTASARELIDAFVSRWRDVDPGEDATLVG